jgi:hypothetical protein
MPEMKRLRKHLFVDPKIQGTLMARVVFYWIVCLLGITLMLLCWRIVTGPPRMFATHLDEMWLNYGPAVIASFLLLPLVIMDVLRLSNRFVGPLLRLRRSMRQLGRGEEVEPIEFRETDFWPEFADEFNAIRLRLQLLSTSVAKVKHEEQGKKDEEEPVSVG